MASPALGVVIGLGFASGDNPTPHVGKTPYSMLIIHTRTYA